jgi:hypothetical protein
MQLKVFRPTSRVDQFEVIAETALEPITPGQLNRFPTDLQAQGGDVLGDSRPGGTAMSAFFFTEDPGDTVAVAPNADDPVGGTTTVNPAQGRARLDISAVLQQPPRITALSTSSGPIRGGTSVRISGHDFTGATAVAFGGVPAADFLVESDGRVTATAPPSARVGAVAVSVTTPLGTTPAVDSDQFSYTGCLVPRLRGEGLKVAKRKLRSAACHVGSVKKRGDATTKNGRVVKQSPRAGAVRTTGTLVRLTLGD